MIEFTSSFLASVPTVAERRPGVPDVSCPTSREAAVWSVRSAREVEADRVVEGCRIAAMLRMRVEIRGQAAT